MSACSRDIVPVDPCTPRQVARFKPGIATRVIPSCSPNACGIDCGQPAWWVNNAGTLDRRDWIKGWVVNQLSGVARADCSDLQNMKPTGGWWADAFRVNSGQQRQANFVTGSKLWTLPGRISNSDTLLMAKHYVDEALGYLITIGIASSIVTEATYSPKKTLIQIKITVNMPGRDDSAYIEGQQQPNYSWLWS